MDERRSLKSLLSQAVALLVLLIVSGGAGLLLWGYSTRYEASTILILPSGSEAGAGLGSSSRLPGDRQSLRYPDGPSFFRRIQPILGSTSAIEYFAAGRGLTADPAVIRFVNQTRARRSEPVSFDFSYGINRADVRDLPDVLSLEILKNSQVRFSVNVRVSDRTAAEAAHAEKIFVEYARDLALRVAIADMMQQFTNFARTQDAKIETDLSETRIRLASIDRQVSDLEKIRGTYGEGAGTDMVSVPPDLSVGRRFLSPARQLVALQTELSELRDREIMGVSRRKSLSALERYVAAVQERTEKEPNATARLATAFNSLDMMASSSSGSPEEILALAVVRASINEALVWLRAYFVDQPPEPREPIVYLVGPPRSVVVGAALLFGFIVWLVFVRGALRGLLR